MTRPEQTEYAPYYHGYITLVDTDDLIGYMEQQRESTDKVLTGISEDKAEFRYAPGKWSIKEMISHLIDMEYIFTYRLLRIARNDKTELAGVDENLFAKESRADDRSMKELTQHLRITREATLALIRTLNEDELARVGTANGYRTSARALAYSTAGHEAHHMRILAERYLNV